MTRPLTRRELRTQAASAASSAERPLSRRELRDRERDARFQQQEPAPVPAPTAAVLTAPSLIDFDDIEVTAPIALPESKPVPVRPGVSSEQRAAAPTMANTADTAPTVIIRDGDTQPQPILIDPVLTRPVADRSESPEAIRRTRATTLRAKRTVAVSAPTHPPVRPARRIQGVVRRFAAGGVLLVAGAFLVATTVPAQAFLSGGDQAGAEWQSSEGQTIDVPANASQLELNIHGDIGVEDALASARISPERVAEIQAVADVDTRANGYRAGLVGYEQALPMLNTSYVQTPFPLLPDVPISSGFAWRWGKVHEGIDFTPGSGTEIRPMSNGIVTNIQYGSSSGGHMVTIDHMIDGKRYQTVYAHMIAGSIQVEEGQVVTIDQVIGQVGSTGFSTGPHLHFEMRTSNDIAIDPIRWWDDRIEYTAASAVGGYR